MTRFALTSADTKPVAAAKIAPPLDESRCECGALIRTGKHTPKCSKATDTPSVAPVNTSKETKTMATAKKVAKKAAKPVAKKVARSAKPKVKSKCGCGCGGLTGGNFVPGHDARLVGQIKRGELKSLTEFQAQFAKKHGIKLGEAKQAAKKVRTAA